MAQLGIKGHATRGKEVIKILEMLGGENPYAISTAAEGLLYRISNYDNRIVACSPTDTLVVFSLEEFLEKFPYKVGDKVKTKHPDTKGILIDEIVDMKWDYADKVLYELSSSDLLRFYAEELQPYKEETMEENIKEKCDLINFNSHYIFDFADRVELVLKDDWEVKNEEGKTFVVRKQSPYPKTYHECWKILDVGEEEVLLDGVTASEEVLFDSFIKLKRCRDAYWKIAGSWKPDWADRDQPKFVISIVKEEIELNEYYFEQKVLAFPTEEMRDAFYENFKELIEECKELL